ncbi:hypothetical protein Ancab_032505 [Ancistrocladus abbreviatus]
MARLTLSFRLLFSSVLLMNITAESSAILKDSKASTDFIWSSCRATRYPSLCFHSLSAYADKIHQSDQKLALTALAVSLAKARSTALYVSKFSKLHGIKHREFEAVKDCIENMGDSVDELSRSVRELGHTGQAKGQSFMWHMSNVQTWVSAALTDEQTCADGFSGHIMDGNIKAAINQRMMDVAQFTSNALALVNRFASRH